jgi:SMODS and SLOG-associating 2TM effector domain 1/SMODS and SLOG-associating 2TM effector domain 3
MVEVLERYQDGLDKTLNCPAALPTAGQTDGTATLRREETNVIRISERRRVRAGQVSDEMASPALRDSERQAAARQRLAARLQAGYLVILLLAPMTRLVPVPGRERDRYDEIASAVLLLAALAMRLVLRSVAADAGWVRARRESEQLRARAWLRCMAGASEPGDGPLATGMRTADIPTRWQFYRQHRMDDQIGYFARRATQHRRTASRWRAVRLTLTAGTFLVAIASLLIHVSAAMIGLVSALLASSEAWLQFKRSDTLAVSYTEAHDELTVLREQEPADEQSLNDAVVAVELALAHERWTWTAIMSVSVLTSPARPASSGKDNP